MTDQRNMFLAIVLSMAILFGWDYYFSPEPTPVPAEGETAQPLTAPDAPQPVAPGIEAPGIEAPGTPKPADRANTLTEFPRAGIDTPSLRGSVPLQGLRFDDLTLKGYRETTDPASAEIDLLSPAGSLKPYYAELGWLSADPSLALPTAETAWQTGSDGPELTPDRPLVLTWDNGAGLMFRRTVTIDQEYMFTVYDEVENKTDQTISLFPYGLIARIDTPDVLGFFILHEGPLGVFDETLKEMDYDELQETPVETVNSTGGWIGFTDKYWLAVLAHEQDKTVKPRSATVS